METLTPNEKQEVEPTHSHEWLDYEDIQRQARELLALREQLPSVEVKQTEREDNARTALMEALTATGHLSKVEIAGDTLEEIHEQVMDRLLNGYSDDLPVHERWRRFYEICEEIYVYRNHCLIEKGELDPAASVAIVSDFPDMPATDAQKLGYRPQNRKGMVRSTHLEKRGDTFVRVIEQVSRSDSGTMTTRRLLAEHGAHVDESLPHDIAALKTPFTYSRRELADGVVDLQRKLDSYSGPTIRYGEDVRAPHDEPLLNYDELRHESAEREQQIEVYIERLAGFEQRLDEAFGRGAITWTERQSQYAHEVRQILRAICTLAPQYAADCFGEKAAAYYSQAADFELIGDVAHRDHYLQKAAGAEGPVTFCGVLISPEKAKELGIGLDPLGSLIAEGKKNWAYKKGVCRVSGCKTRPGKTQVGPCSVCKSCEKLFDRGVLK